MSTPEAVPVVVLSGTVGAGKTTVLHEVSELLQVRGVGHLALDIDALTYTYPRPPDDPYGQGIALAGLTAVWAAAQEAGATRAVLARVVEQPSDLDGYRSAIPGAALTVVRVRAAAEVVAARLRGRERGASLAWHLARAVELDADLDAASVEDHTVANEGPAPDVAAEVLALLGW